MEIDFHTSSSGESYVGNFISNLNDMKAKKKILKRFETLERYGVSSLTQSGTMKKLHGYDLYELKIDFYRIICVIRGATCWLLSIFIKKANKTPLQHILTALQRAKELDLTLSLAVN